MRVMKQRGRRGGWGLRCRFVIGRLNLVNSLVHTPRDDVGAFALTFSASYAPLFTSGAGRGAGERAGRERGTRIIKTVATHLRPTAGTAGREGNVCVSFSPTLLFA